MTERGVLVSPPADVSPAIRKAAETNKEFAFKETVARLNRREDMIMARLFPRFDGRVLPSPLIAISALRVHTLAQYRVVPDEYGLNYKLTFNERYYRPAEEKDLYAGLAGMVWVFGEWSQAEVQSHETAHHVQELTGTPYKHGRSAHDPKFIAMLENLGIHAELHTGVHTRPADLDGPFGKFMAELGIKRADKPYEAKPKTYWWEEGHDRPIGHSSLALWACALCGLKVRVGIHDDPQLLHTADGGTFQRG